LNAAFESIERHEATLLTPLVEFLLSKKKAGVRIVGLESVTSRRAPTVSFVVVGADSRTKRLKSKDIVAHVDAAGNASLLSFYPQQSRQTF
jgi:selenocysteine lyase/cysteine desulfurase